MRYAIANWKMNLPPEGIDAWLSAVAAAPAHARLIVAPPFPYIKDIASRALVAAQNCGDQQSGAFTGEVSAAMLRACGARYVIVGHSERRGLYGESDALIAKKLSVAIEAGLAPLLCIGEDLRVRDAGKVAIFLSDQIKAASAATLDRAKEIVIAYEPIWAIGTGRNASGEMVAETVAEIRDALRRFWPNPDLPILYGGSVTPDNVADLTANGGIDGFLVGGASLDSAKFLAIHGSLA